jgi:predicted nuclease with TOPRIM domain
LDSTIASLHGLGTTKQERQSSGNTHTEKDSLASQLESKQADLTRLTEVVQHHSGSLNDTVQAEEKISQLRSEVRDIERQLKKLESRVEYAAIELQLTEQYQARFAWRAVDFLFDLRNSAIEGMDAILVSIGIALGFLLHYGLLVVLWAFLLYWPSRAMWRRYRRGTVVTAATAA